MHFMYEKKGSELVSLRGEERVPNTDGRRNVEIIKKYNYYIYFLITLYASSI